MALHQQLQDKGASDAVFDRLEALFDQLANPKSDKAALLQAIQAFQAELAAVPSASEAGKPASTVETPVGYRNSGRKKKQQLQQEASLPQLRQKQSLQSPASIEEGTPDAPSSQGQIEK